MKSIPWRNFIFARLFVTFIIIILPIILIGFLIYNWGINTVKSDTMTSMHMQTSFYRENFEKEIQRIRLQQITMLNDDSLSMLAAAPSVMGNYERDKAMLNTQQRLNSIKSSSRYIGECRVFFPQANSVISTTSFYHIKKSDLDMITSYTASVGNLFQTIDDKLFLIGEFPILVKNDTALPMSMLTIELSNAELLKMLAELGNEQSSGSFFFSNQKDMMICDSAKASLALKVKDTVKRNWASKSKDQEMQIYSGS